MKQILILLMLCSTTKLYSQGKVGIGTLNPVSSLHIVYNSSPQSAQLELQENQDDFARLRLSNSVYTSRYWDIAGFNGSTASADRINFYNSGVGDVLSLSGNGNVGIATTNPNFKLDVNGSLNFNGPLAIFGNTGQPGQMLRSTGAGNASWAYPTKLIADSSKLRYSNVYFDLVPGTTDALIPGWFQRINLPADARVEINFNMIVEGIACFSCGDSYFGFAVQITRISDGIFMGGANGYGHVANGRKQSISSVIASNNILPPGNYMVDLKLSHLGGPTIRTIAETGSNFFVKAWYQ